MALFALNVRSLADAHAVPKELSKHLWAFLESARPPRPISWLGDAKTSIVCDGLLLTETHYNGSLGLGASRFSNAQEGGLVNCGVQGIRRQSPANPVM